MSRKQILTIILVTAAVAAVHSLIPVRFIALHVLFRLLYFIPITLAALAFGRKGGLAASLTISLIFLPHFWFRGTSSEFIAESAVAIVLFNLCGFFVGSFRESSEINLTRRFRQEKVVPYRDDDQQRVLFYIDGSPLSLGAAKWFGNRHDLSRMSVVLLTVSSADREEKFADTLAGNQTPDKEQALERSRTEIRQALVECGMDEKNLATESITVTERVPISDRINEYLNEHAFDFLLICKHNKKKSEEFLFGDTAIQVLRKTSVPVLVVKGIEEQASLPGA